MGRSFLSSQEQPGLCVVPGHHQLMLETPRVPRKSQHILPTCDIKVSHAEVKP